MTPTTRRRLMALSLTVAALLVWSAVPGSAQVAAAPGAPISALSKVSRCVRERKSLLALLMIDESGSLLTTDPRNERVTAAKTAVESLAGLSEHEIGATKPVVEVAVGGFSVDYQEVAGWTPMSYDAVAGLSAKIDALATQNHGVDTDYAAALVGARHTIDDRTGELGSVPPCRAILWFTDGKYDIEPGVARAVPTKSYAPDIRINTPGGAAALVAAGKDLLCRPDGLVDGLRRDSISNIAIGLTTQLQPADQAFLLALTTGHSPVGTSCGAIDGSTLGAFIPVDNLSDLIASLDTVASLIGYGVQGKPERDVTVCAVSACADGQRGFPVDAGMSRFRLTAETAGDDVSIVLRSPVGELRFEPARGRTVPVVTLGSVPIRVVWLASDVVSIEATLPSDESWIGPWSLTFVRTSGPATVPARGFRIFYFGTVTAALAPTPASSTVPSGASPTAVPAIGGRSVALQFVGAAGGPALSPRVITDATFAVQGALVGGDGATLPAEFHVTGPGQVAATVGPGALPLVASLHVQVTTTTKSGIVLPPQVGALPVTFAPRVAASAVTTVPPVASKAVVANSANGALLIIASIVAALATAFVGAVLIRKRRRGRFADLGTVRVCVGRVRVVRDRIAQSRIVWLSDVGTESALRLNSQRFDSLPPDVVRSLSLGGFTFARADGGASASSEGLLLATGGPGTGPPTVGEGVVPVPAELAPMWVFAGRRREPVVGTRPGASGGRQQASGSNDGATVMVSSASASRDRTHRTGRPDTADPRLRQPGERSGEQAFEGDLLIAIRDIADVARLERRIHEVLARALFAAGDGGDGGVAR